MLLFLKTLLTNFDKKMLFAIINYIAITEKLQHFTKKSIIS